MLKVSLVVRLNNPTILKKACQLVTDMLFDVLNVAEESPCFLVLFFPSFPLRTEPSICGQGG